MALSKIQAESMNLADTYAFTGTVSGAGGGIFESQLLHVQDQKTQGTNGGTTTSTTTHTRDLNTVVTNEITGASLSSNQITLPSGTYYLECHPTNGTPLNSDNQPYLYNVTDSSNELIGTSGRSNYQASVLISGRFTISAQKVFEIRHYFETGIADFGFGYASNQTTEVYTDVKIWKVA